MSSTRTRSSLSPRKRGRVLAVFSVINIICLLILWFAETFIAERHWFTTLATYMPQHLFGIPAAILLLISLIKRNDRMIILNTIAAVLFATALLGFQVNIPFLHSEQGRSLRVMTYNIHGGHGGVANIVAAVKKVNPDVLCLQEADHYSGPSDPTPGIARELEGYHLFRYEELAILSRYPIIDRKIHRMPEISWREYLEATLDVGDQKVTIINTHFVTAHRRSLRQIRNSRISDLRHTGPVRSAQMTRLLDIAASVPNPLIITGDFNTPPRGCLYRRISSRYQDCFASAGIGLGYTYRASLPLMRIDLIFTGEGIDVSKCTAPGFSASDHRPVVADLHLK